MPATTTSNPITDGLSAQVKQGQEFTLKGVDALIDVAGKVADTSPREAFALIPEPKVAVAAGFAFVEEILAFQKKIVTKLVDAIPVTK